MIALVEGANRQKTPNEIALNILLAALTIIFLIATVTMQPMAIYAKAQNPGLPDFLALTGDGVSGIVLVSLLVCLIPTTIGGPVVGHRHRRRWTGWCSGTSWRCRAGPSRRRATCRRCCSTRPAPSPWATGRPPSSCPVAGVAESELAEAAQLSSLADETPEGCSIVVFAKERYGLREREVRDAEWCRSPRRPACRG